MGLIQSTKAPKRKSLPGKDGTTEKRWYGLSPESQDQNTVMPVLHVPHSLDRGGGATSAAELKPPPQPYECELKADAIHTHAACSASVLLHRDALSLTCPSPANQSVHHKSQKDAGLYCGSRLRSGEVCAYVG